MIPQAKVNKSSMSLRKFFSILLQAASVGVVVAFLTGLTIKSSEIGCRNSAITYAKTIYPNAKCSALDTCSCDCKDDTDMAICSTETKRYVCKYSSYTGTARCDEVNVGQ